MKQNALILMSIGLAAIAKAGVQTPQMTPLDRPNILFLAIDDLRPELGCYGSEIAITPNMDKLASEGLLFNRAYCQEAICGPSRASLMCGARPDTIKVVENYAHFRVLNPDIVTLSQQFIANGYNAVEIGKIFHNQTKFGDEASWNFKRAKIDPPKPKYYPYALPENQQNLKETKAFLEEKYWVGVGKTGLVHGPAYEFADVPDNAYRDGHNADIAIATMKEMIADGKPFFMGLGFYKPHLEFIAPKKYWDLYDHDSIPLAEHTTPPQDGAAMGLHASFEMRVRSDIPKAGNFNPELSRNLKHAYLGCVSYIDAQIGKVLAALEEAGVRDNTIIILWGDHGWHLGDMGIWGKATNYEISARVPLMIWTPNMPDRNRGKKTDALVELVDMYPTLCDLANLSTPDHVEGTSFMPLLTNPDRKWEDAAFTQFPNPALREWAANPLMPQMRETFFGPLIEQVEERIIKQQGDKWDRELFENHLMGYAMRTDRYRLVLWKDVRTPDAAPVDIELYDHKNDPHETVNIADSKPEIVADLIKRFNARDKVYPLTDLANEGGWILNQDLSDEFDGHQLDEDKWQVCGRDGVFWAGKFKGRTFDTKYTDGIPGGWQYSPENVRVENGLLKIATKYDPDYPWVEPGSDVFTHTTGGIWTKKTYTHGYMEMKCKLPRTKQTGAFWTTGDGAELDVFEAIGKHPKRENLMWSSIHDWKHKGHKNVSWTDTKPLPFDFADGFHTYAAEWDEHSVKIYADGQLVHEITKEHVETAKGDHNSDRWPMDVGHHVWADSEIFEWWAVPEPASLPSDFEVEYIRVWQKEQ
ncbi:sulfatase-like hydrolase/transferase [Pontiellaceae bacterium B12227]|nr:sulfatase-like hydrolase/transferase [Pontiellaceae bacterium B12227]